MPEQKTVPKGSMIVPQLRKIKLMEEMNSVSKVHTATRVLRHAVLAMQTKRESSFTLKKGVALAQL